jgi:DNA-binding Lrp family transcriptional regulator
VALDDVDRRLLDALRQDGRVSFEELGRAAQVSRPAARARVHRMLADGAVRIETIVHPAEAGLMVMAHASVSVRERSAKAVAESLSARDSCPFVSRVVGRVPLVAEIRTSDLRTLEEELAAIRVLDGVIAVDTVLYTDIVKDPYLPIGRPDEFPRFDLDDTDRHLLALLRGDPRASYAELAAGVGLSRGATRARVARLLDGGVAAVIGLTTSLAAGRQEMCGLALRLGPEPGAMAEVARIPEVDFVAATVGRCDALGTVKAPDRARALAVLDEVAAIPGIRVVETWWHVDLVKERYGPS